MAENKTLNTLLNESDASGEKPRGNGKKKLPRLIFLILGAIIVAEAYFVIGALRSTPPPPRRLQVRPIGDARLVLVSNKKEYKVGEFVQVQIRLDTGGHATNGTDVILKYDPEIFEASKSSVTTGKIYDDYPVADADPKAGSIKISGISNVASKGFNGVGILANLNLKAKSLGSGNISFEFKQGSTTDSNVIKLKTAEDILGKVTNLEVSIR